MPWPRALSSRLCTVGARGGAAVLGCDAARSLVVTRCRLAVSAGTSPRGAASRHAAVSARTPDSRRPADETPRALQGMPLAGLLGAERKDCVA